MSRDERCAARAAALVRAIDVPCRKLPKRASVRCLWTAPTIHVMRHWHRWLVKHIARFIATATMWDLRQQLRL